MHRLEAEGRHGSLLLCQQVHLSRSWLIGPDRDTTCLLTDNIPGVGEFKRWLEVQEGFGYFLPYKLAHLSKSQVHFLTHRENKSESRV